MLHTQIHTNHLRCVVYHHVIACMALCCHLCTQNEGEAAKNLTMYKHRYTHQ